MADDKKTLKFQMMMSPAEARFLDDWMFKNRIRSRAEAIRRLCEIGIGAEEYVLPGVLQEVLSTLERVEHAAFEQIEVYEKHGGPKSSDGHKYAFGLALSALADVSDQLELTRLNLESTVHAFEQIKASKSTMASALHEYSRGVEEKRSKIRERLLAKGYTTEPDGGKS